MPLEGRAVCHHGDGVWKVVCAFCAVSQLTTSQLGSLYVKNVPQHNLKMRLKVLLFVPHWHHHTGGIELCPRTSLPVFHFVPWIHHWCGTQCTTYSACNLPKAMDDPAGAGSSTLHPQSTFPKPSAHGALSSRLAQCQFHTTTRTGTGATGIAKAHGKGGHPPPENMPPDGPLSYTVQ